MSPVRIQINTMHRAGEVRRTVMQNEIELQKLAAKHAEHPSPRKNRTTGTSWRRVRRLVQPLANQMCPISQRGSEQIIIQGRNLPHRGSKPKPWIFHTVAHSAKAPLVSWTSTPTREQQMSFAVRCKCTYFRVLNFRSYHTGVSIVGSAICSTTAEEGRPKIYFCEHASLLKAKCILTVWSLYALSCT